MGGPRGQGPRQPGQARTGFVSLVVSGGSQPADSLRLVLGPRKRRAECRGSSQHLLPVGGPQWCLATEPLARHARVDPGQPACLFESVVTGDPRHLREEPRRRRHADSRLVQYGKQPVARAGRESRHLVGSRPGENHGRADAEIALSGDVRRDLAPGSPGPPRPADRVLLLRRMGRIAVERRGHPGGADHHWLQAAVAPEVARDDRPGADPY